MNLKLIIQIIVNFFIVLLITLKTHGIIHSNNYLDRDQISMFDFEFCKPNCDGRFSYLFYKLNYKIINDLKLIKTYHYHSSNLRTYNINDKITGPALYIIPCKFNINDWIYVLYTSININFCTYIIFMLFFYIFAHFKYRFYSKK